MAFSLNECEFRPTDVEDFLQIQALSKRREDLENHQKFLNKKEKNMEKIPQRPLYRDMNDGRNNVQVRRNSDENFKDYEKSRSDENTSHVDFTINASPPRKKRKIRHQSHHSEREMRDDSKLARENNSHFLPLNNRARKTKLFN